MHHLSFLDTFFLSQFYVKVFLQFCLLLSFVFQLLDISELDMVGAGREAKRRRKTLGNYFSIEF